MPNSGELTPSIITSAPQTGGMGGFTTGSGGAFVSVVRTERTMTTYAFTEGELSTIGTLSITLNIAVAIGGSAFGFMLSTLIDFHNATDVARRNGDFAGIVLTITVLLICAGIGIWARKSRNAEVERIKNESKTVDGSAR